ncbi:MAG: hypothetical protein ACM3QS_07405 [Bacteroidota bacterium]
MQAIPFLGVPESEQPTSKKHMPSSHIRQIGFGSGVVLVGLGLAYLGLFAAMMLSGSGFPPTEPLQTIFNILILLTAVWMVFFWSVLHQAVSAERKLFTRASLMLIVIFAALTSINRYVALTVVRQSLSSGNTNGLDWFMPYGWPSVMLALEILGWGFFFGLACLCLAPVFTTGPLERAISRVLIATGILSLLAPLGQVIGSNALAFNPFTLAATAGWGPGLTAAVALITVWFRKAGISTE